MTKLCSRFDRRSTQQPAPSFPPTPSPSPALHSPPTSPAPAPHSIGSSSIRVSSAISSTPLTFSPIPIRTPLSSAEVTEVHGDAQLNKKDKTTAAPSSSSTTLGSSAPLTSLPPPTSHSLAFPPISCSPSSVQHFSYILTNAPVHHPSTAVSQKKNAKHYIISPITR